MARKRSRKPDRDGTAFLALPHVVTGAPAFLSLSGSAIRLLIDIARQYNGSNNGCLTACMSQLEKRGWTSNETLTKARRELMSAGFILETRKGMRPNRAAWFAITWNSLDWSPEMDIKKESFQRSAYIHAVPDLKNEGLKPNSGVSTRKIAPKSGVASPAATPKIGAIRPIFRIIATPETGDFYSGSHLHRHSYRPRRTTSNPCTTPKRNVGTALAPDHQQNQGAAIGVAPCLGRADMESRPIPGST